METLAFPAERKQIIGWLCAQGGETPDLSDRDRSFLTQHFESERNLSRTIFLNPVTIQEDHLAFAAQRPFTEDNVIDISIILQSHIVGAMYFFADFDPEGMGFTDAEELRLYIFLEKWADFQLNELNKSDLYHINPSRPFRSAALERICKRYLALAQPV